MEYSEVKSILRDVQHVVQDKIYIKPLLVFFKGHIGEYSLQKISAHNQQHGDPHASYEFFDVIQKSPREFPHFLAALKKDYQLAVLEDFMKAVRKNFRNKQQRLREIENLIRIEEDKLQIPRDDEDNEQDVAYGGPSHGGLQSRGNQSRPTTSEPDLRKCQRLVYSRTNKEAGQPKAAQPKTPPPSPVDNRQADMKIFDLQSATLSRLERELTTPSDKKQTWHKWKYLCRNSDSIGISREQERAIEAEGDDAGEKFFDILNERVTVAQLEKILREHGMNFAISILGTDSRYWAEATDGARQVGHRNTGRGMARGADDETERNALSLNLNQRENLDKGSKYKSLPPDSGAAREDIYLQSVQPEAETKISNDLNRCRMKGHPNIPVDNDPDSSTRSITDNEMMEVYDPPVKGTEAYQVVTDRENKFTQENADIERPELASDRVKQIPVGQDTGNLSSFQDIGGKEKSSEIESINVQGEVEHIEYSSNLENPDLEVAARTEEPGRNERKIPHLEHVQGNIPVVEQRNEFGNIHETEDRTEEKKRFLPLAEPDSDTATVVAREEVGSMEQESHDSHHTGESEDGGSTSYSENQSVAESAGSLDETIGMLETTTLESTRTQDEEDKTEGSV